MLHEIPHNYFTIRNSYFYVDSFDFLKFLKFFQNFFDLFSKQFSIIITFALFCDFFSFMSYIFV